MSKVCLTVFAPGNVGNSRDVVSTCPIFLQGTIHLIWYVFFRKYFECSIEDRYFKAVRLQINSTSKSLSR